MTRAWEDKAVKPNKKQPGRQVGTGQQPVRTARVSDPDACPSGYDPDVWDMALLFEQLAEKHDVQLVLGRPMIYAKLLRRMEELRDTLADKDRRDQPWDHNGLPMPRGAWSVDGITRVATWQQLGRAAIRYEWKTYNQDTYAADWFCGKVRFWEMISEVRARGYFRHCDIQLAKQVASQSETTLEEDLDAMARREARRLELRHDPPTMDYLRDEVLTYEDWLEQRRNFLAKAQAFNDRRMIHGHG